MGSASDKARGATNSVVGGVKKAAGKATGDQRLQSKGEAQQIKGDAQKALGNAKDAIGGALKKAGRAVQRSGK